MVWHRKALIFSYLCNHYARIITVSLLIGCFYRNSFPLTRSVKSHILSMRVGMKAMQNHDEADAASFDFLMYSGYVVLGYFHLRAALEAAGYYKSRIKGLVRRF